jgi:hypothetical protein
MLSELHSEPLNCFSLNAHNKCGKCKWKCIYPPIKSMAFTASLPCTLPSLLHQNHKLGKNTQILVKFNFHSKYDFYRAYFPRIHAYSTEFCKDLYTILHDNSNTLITDTSPQTDEHVVSTQDILFYRY